MALLNKLKNIFTRDSSGSPAVMSSGGGRSIYRKVQVLGVLLILSIVVMAVVFTIENISARQNKTYFTLSSQQEVLSQQIAINALEASTADRDGFKELASNQAQFLNNLSILQNGDPQTGLPALPDIYNLEFSDLRSSWNGYNKSITTIVQAGDSMQTVSNLIVDIEETLPELVTLSEDVISILANAKAPQRDVAVAARQLALVVGLKSSLNQILNEGDVVMEAAHKFSIDAELIGRQADGMLKGSSELKIKKFTNAEAITKLVRFKDEYSVVAGYVNQIDVNSQELFNVHESVINIQALSEGVLNRSRQLGARIELGDSDLKTLSLVGYAFGVLALLLLGLLAALIIRESQQRLTESQEQNDKNQRAILRLLDEMTNLADGDLSTHTTVTEDITGAIADSVNYSIDALRDLVGTINNTAVQVSSAVRRTQKTTILLAEASETQAKEIASASSAVTRISDSMSSVSERATDSAEVARKSVSIAHKGGETVRQTIEGMETIREQIQETSKRIKRLGESSQEIGDIVGLITEISDQTNILALNAAIQASMAGEAGRGFAVVADEVQRLAERTGDATKQIEALVKTIQADTNEATVSMEHSTSNVVKGARLAENAGSALDRIEQVSMNLAQRILEISDSTKEQAADSVKITKSMDAIQSITLRTSEGTTEASNAMGQLASMVGEMHNSVDGFKLPGMGSSDSTMISHLDDLAGFNLNEE
ncbi:MAG: twitching motility protein PilJ [Gammaproteobacteria bacterium]|jgi:twitching motility protein PilJ